MMQRAWEWEYGDRIDALFEPSIHGQEVQEQAGPEHPEGHEQGRVWRRASRKAQSHIRRL